MNLSIPILIADEHEEIRSLQREMLARNGYFHLVEAHSSEEVIQMYDENHFLIIHSRLISTEVYQLLRQRNKFLIVTQNDALSTPQLAANLGVRHLMSFPYSARILVEKINSIMS
jgi:DNA-binding NarL/FixJ family response regulator